MSTKKQENYLNLYSILIESKLKYKRNEITKEELQKIILELEKDRMKIDELKSDTIFSSFIKTYFD